MKPKISLKQLNFYFIGLLLALQTVVTYDLRDSWACSSFAKDDINVTTYPSDSSELSYYRFLMVDPVANRLFVGSMNKVTILDLNDISTQVQVIELKPDINKLNYCIYQKPETPNCQNHIRFITKTKDSSSPEYFLCGTNALSPAGYNLTHNGNSYSTSYLGSTACSDDPFSNLTVIYVKTGNPDNEELMYYGATAFDRSTVYRPIKKKDGDGNVNEYMKGVFSNKWMKDPQFAGSFDVEDRVFFFFREIAVETEFIESKLYSRVGKFCKKDTGGDSLLRNKWTSYQKARLNCSLSGAFPSYFDVIQDVATIDHKTFYGLFTTNANGLPASAICAFDKDDIDAVFDQGQFKTQKTDMSFWTAATDVPTPRPGVCQNDSMKIADTVLGFIVDHPLMHDAIQQKYGKPLFYFPGEELQQLEMEYAPVHQSKVIDTSTAYVFYAGSNRGQVYKILSQDTGTQFNTHVSSIYSPYDQTQVIWSLKQHDKYVYLGTDHAVTQINVQNDCMEHHNVDSCVYDPHCVWYKLKDSCEHYRHVSESDDFWSYMDYSPVGNQNEFFYENGRNVTKTEFLTLKMNLINKNICALGRNIVWKKQLKGKDSFEKLKFDDNHFVDNQNSLVISNLTLNDEGTYKAYDLENPSLIAALYRVQVVTESNIKRIYRAKFDDWCEYFDKGKVLQNQYSKRCNPNV